jgi:hypothetical protein
MGLTKQQLEALNNNSFPNNNAGAITPAILRDYNTSAIANTVNQDVYTTDSASVDSRLDNLENFSSSLVTNFATVAYVNGVSASLTTTASFNAYTQSTNTFTASISTSVGLLQTFSGSQYKADSASFSARIEAVTGSSVDTGSLVTTASFNAYTASQDFLNTTFATTSSVNSLSASIFSTDATQSSLISGKLDTSSFNTFSTSVDSRLDLLELSGSGFVTTASFNTYTSSQDFKNTTFATTSSLNAVSTSVGLLQTFSGSEYKNDSSSFDSRILAITGSGGNVSVQEEGSILGDATSFNFLGAGVTATFSAGTASVTIPGGGGSIDTGSFATTGSNTFTGNQTIEGAIVSNITSSVIKLFSAGFVSGAVQLNITASSAISQSNLVLVGTPLIASSTSTGSIIISGSNNILTTGVRTNTLVSSFSYGYIGGSGNTVATIPTLHTQSLVSPTMNNNQLNGAVTLNFITSSTLANPTFNNNQILGGTTITHQSGSIAFSGNIVMGNGFGSTANTTTLTLNSTIAQNIVAGISAISLNHNSSSILYSGNIGGGMTVTNNYSSSVSTAVNNITVQGNAFAGTGHTLLVSGSNTANRRTFSNNIIVGSTNAISSDLSGSSGGHLISTAIIGQNLIVSASGTSTTAGGGAFFGRYNDITNLLADSGKTIFAVGSGTGTGNRKTALSVDSSSVVYVSGSLLVSGSSTFSGSMAVSGTINTITIDSSGNVTASTFLATSNGSTAFVYNQQSTGSVAGVYNTNYGKDGLSVYQYQGQPYAFNVILTANQINAYTGSEFQWGLQTNGTLSLPGGGSTYFAMSSGSTITGSGGGANKVGLDFLETAMIMDIKADTSFNRRVYVDKGMYVSQSVGGAATPALTVNGTNAASNLAIVATGSCVITGSLNLNGQTTFASLGSNTFTNTQIVSSSIYIAPNNNNNQLYLPSGSNKQTGIATLDGGNPGTVTVSNSNVTANSIIMLTKQTNNHPNAGPVVVSSKGSGTFTITSNHNGDTDVVAFMIINPS